MLTKISELDIQHYSFRLHNIIDTAIHMHDAYEIIFVLRGTVDLKCTAFNYSLSEGDVFVINVKELHKFSNGSQDNAILMLHFDPYAYHHIVPDLDYYFFVCDSYASDKKDDSRLLSLHQLLLQFALSTLDGEESGRKPEEHLLSLISFMISNFQSYLATPQGYRSNTSLENRDYQTDRIREIQNYLYSNSRNKITLDELAEHLHLNKYYVSHLCKSIIGLSMTDFLSLIRVEQSELLLLSSDKSIEQIAFEYGFSARRYYEKHFFKWHGVSPSEYRKAFLNDQEEHRCPMELSLLKSGNMRSVIRKYIKSDDAVPVPSNYFDFTVDLNASVMPFQRLPEDSITISDPYRCLKYINADIIRQAKKDLWFSRVRLKNIFTDATTSHFTPESLNNLLDILTETDLDIIICVTFPKSNTDAFCKLVARFFHHIETRYGETLLSRCTLEVSSTSHAHIGTRKLHDMTESHMEDLRKTIPGIPVTSFVSAEELNQFTHNSMLLLPHIIGTCMKQNREEAMLYREFYDCTADLDDTSGRLYHNNCLLTERLEKTPLYYMWYLMAQLGNELIHMRPGLIATKKGRAYCILLYDFSNGELYRSNEHSNLFRLHLSNVKKRYIVTTQYLDSERCLFHQRSAMDFPSTLPLQVVDRLNQATAPTVNFALIDPNHTDVTLRYALNPNSILLLTLTEST